jgi:sarcosine oxidase subunit delta
MKLMTCPINGPRAIGEFICAGELREPPDPHGCDDLAWANYVFNRNSVPGIKREWWCHTPSGVWFIAERNTATDSIVRTYLYRPVPRTAESRP